MVCRDMGIQKGSVQHPDMQATVYRAMHFDYFQAGLYSVPPYGVYSIRECLLLNIHETATMPNQIIYITAALLFIDIFPLPAGYHELLTIVAGGTFAWGCYVNILKKSLLPALLYALFAIIYNPLKDLELTRQIWIAADLAAGTLLIATKNYFER